MYQYWLITCNRNRRESSSGRKSMWEPSFSSIVPKPSTALKNTKTTKFKVTKYKSRHFKTEKLTNFLKNFFTKSQIPQ